MQERKSAVALLKLRTDARTIFQAGLRAADPEQAVCRHLSCSGGKLKVGEREYDLSDYRRIIVVGAGKAAAAMAKAVEKLLGERISEGLIIVKYGHTAPLDKIEQREAGHPIPDEAGLEGAGEMLLLLESAGEQDLVLCLLSGGGSALLPQPAPGLSLPEIQELTQLLLERGAAIQELNALRKHLSSLKGGRLARLVAPASLIVLILSDVVGDDLSSIASGPSVPDPTTFADCMRIVDRFGIADQVSPNTLAHLKKGAGGDVEETPKPGDQIFAGVQNLIVGNNLQALTSCRSCAQELGYHALLLSSTLEGETREVARVHTAMAREILATGNPVGRPACLLSGGETTVTIRGGGRGGRNLEFTLAAAVSMAGWGGVVVLSAGTDGSDGTTDAAGAIADGQTVSRALRQDMDPQRYLDDNDSYPFFESLGDLVVTGPTLTNVMDLRIVLVG